jgi:hypothetical protein
MSKLTVFSIIALVGIVVNFSLLYFMNFQLRDEVSRLKNSPSSQIVVESETAEEKKVVAASGSAETCSGCREDIDEIKEMIKDLAPTGTSFTSIPSANTSQSKEYFVPLGNGSVQSQDWIDVPGMSATIDSTNYSKIKSVTFQISLRIPTANGTVYARLFNKTDQHPVWYSEVSSEGPISTIKQASNISLDSGSKVYQVQMKNSLQYESIADSAQIKITLQ